MLYRLRAQAAHARTILRHDAVLHTLLAPPPEWGLDDGMLFSCF